MTRHRSRPLHRRCQTTTIPSSRSLLTIPFSVPAYWTPEQALAVVELLDELRELIWSHDEMKLLDEFHKHRQPQSCDPSGSPPDDPPF
ncbi:hypothetical protein [Bradyrhizobium sp.]|jgi:hypothetical protein|uniref:hypothetical protein n=1 Tax=Bradyrhizobium sp. TaxID=376 RepID=UPI002B59FFD6|nr:hypothetical protein [Bradyrhizobium sp.]HWX64427.1 hypothetical protein [Bradyrhizobium sp.]